MLHRSHKLAHRWSHTGADLLSAALSSIARAMLSDRILFIDAEAIVLDKPAGLPVDAPRRGGDSIASRLDELKCGFQRPPTARESARAEEFLRGGTWEEYAQVLLGSNEFLFVD